MAKEVPTKSAVNVIGSRNDQTMVALMSVACGLVPRADSKVENVIEEAPIAKSKPIEIKSKIAPAHKMSVRCRLVC